MDGGFYDPTASVVLQLARRNKMATACIERFTARHVLIDVGLGVVGIIPGAAIPALMFAIAAQGPAVYWPMARELQQIYLAPPSELADVQIDKLPLATVVNGAIDIVADLGVDFLKEIAWEILQEAGVGAAAGICIPIVGGAIAAGLDMYVARKMTLRVGRMVALYFQRGARWKDGDRMASYEEAKTMTGDLDSVRRTNPEVREALLKNLRTIIKMVRGHMSRDQINQMLRSQGVPDDLISEALAAA